MVTWNSSNRRVHWASAAVIVGIAATTLLVRSRVARPAFVPSARVLPSEFERQQSILLAWESRPSEQREVSWRRTQQAQQETIVQIAAAIWKNVPVTMLVADETSEVEARRALTAAGVDCGQLRFCRSTFNSHWIRDYGPTPVRDAALSSKVVWLDAEYFPPGHIRPLDDSLPTELAGKFQAEAESLPLVLHGGMLLSNGAGTCLLSERVYQWNVHHNYSPKDVDQLVKQRTGASQLVTLKALVGEPTGHIDMFAAFTASDTVVVGRYRREEDATNAAILDENARRLAQVRVGEGRLRVVRVPMAPRGRKLFGGTYTNVVFANGVLLLPSYGIDPQGEAEARATYQSLLPGWKIVSIDCNALIAEEGALRCVTKNLPLGSYVVGELAAQ